MKRRFVLAGAIGGLAMSAVFLVARAVAGVPTPSELFADTLAPHLPVHLFGIIIGLARGYTPLKILGFSTTIIGQVVVGALAATALARTNRPRRIFALIVVALYVATVALFWSVMLTQYHGVPAGRARVENLALYAFAYAVYVCVAVLLARQAVPSTVVAGRSRGGFVAGAIASVAALAGGAAWASIFARATFPYDGRPVLGEGLSVLTPPEQFYCVTKNVTDPAVVPAVWRLRVDGAVAQPAEFDLQALVQRGALHQETTLMCINNAPEGGLMSNAIWTGVPLRTLLGDAAGLEGVREIALHGADNYIDTIPLHKALEPTTLVAWEMNGAGLLRKHGAPVRMVVPGWFGEKSAKWLTRLEARRDERKGFYARQGWGPSFIIPTHSRIDVPAADAHLTNGSSVELHGVAFAGDRGVSRVEVTTDAGRTWREATFMSPYRQLAWRLWSFDWRPPAAGTYVLSVRATDGAGAVQTAQQRPAATEGATGLHRITVHVA